MPLWDTDVPTAVVGRIDDHGDADASHSGGLCVEVL
jgi:hypothetical protein